MRVGIIGMGVVGGATAKVFGQKHEIIAYDKYKTEYQNIENLKEAKIIFLCVPTPMKPSGEIDYTAMHDSMKKLTKLFEDKELDERPLIIIRSTAVSGTTDSFEKQYLFRFAFNPEFLTEKNALQDMMNTDRVVIGTNRKEDYEKALGVYKPLFPNAKYVDVSTKTAEMIKYAANVMLASQIGVANEIYNICKSAGVDYEEVRKAVLLDDRVGKNIKVPGPDGDFGFGGKCFPKDINALIYLARENMYRPYLLEEVWRLNERVRKDKDWLEIKGATSSKSFG